MNGDDVGAFPFEFLRLGADMRLAACVNPDGSTAFWFLVRGGADDTGCTDCATHEALGPLPVEWQERVDALPVTRYGAEDDGRSGGADDGRSGGADA
jgi:hypothetical protein